MALWFLLSLIAFAVILAWTVSHGTDKALLQRLGPPLDSYRGALRVGLWRIGGPLGALLVYPGGVVVVYVKTAFIDWSTVKAIRRSGRMVGKLRIEHTAGTAPSPIILWPGQAMDRLIGALERTWGHEIVSDVVVNTRSGSSGSLGKE